MPGKKFRRRRIRKRTRPWPLSLEKRKRRTAAATMAIRVRSTFHRSRERGSRIERGGRGIEPFVAGNDDRRSRMGARERGRGAAAEEDIIMVRTSSVRSCQGEGGLAGMKRGKKKKASL